MPNQPADHTDPEAEDLFTWRVPILKALEQLRAPPNEWVVRRGLPFSNQSRNDDDNAGFLMIEST